MNELGTRSQTKCTLLGLKMSTRSILLPTFEGVVVEIRHLMGWRGSPFQQGAYRDGPKMSMDRSNHRFSNGWSSIVKIRRVGRGACVGGVCSVRRPYIFVVLRNDFLIGALASSLPKFSWLNCSIRLNVKGTNGVNQICYCLESTGYHGLYSVSVFSHNPLMHRGTSGFAQTTG